MLVTVNVFFKLARFPFFLFMLLINFLALPNGVVRSSASHLFLQILQ